MFKVKEVAKDLGINPQTLYFYERTGLIPSPQRTEAGYRLYSETDIERLRFITRTKMLGLTLDEIREILALKEGQTLTCQAVQERLAAKLARVREQIQQLQILQQDLQLLLKQCEIAPPNQACVVLEVGVLQNPVNP